MHHQHLFRVAETSPKLSTWANAGMVPIPTSAGLRGVPPPSSAVPRLNIFQMPAELLSKLAELDKSYVQEEFCTKLEKTSAIETTVEDEFGIFREFAALVHSHERICAHSGHGKLNEAEQRRGVDGLVALAWQRTEEGPEKYSVRLEQALRLHSQRAGGVRVSPTAIADVLILSEHTINLDDVDIGLQGLGARALFCQMSWADVPSIEMKITTANLCGELKAAENERNRGQLLFDLSTMQRQQDAIGMDPFEIFGYTAADGIVAMYSMHWVGARGDPLRYLWLQEHKEVAFNLKLPVDILRFFVFLCRLRDHILANAHAAFRGLTAGGIARSLVERGEWRAADRPVTNTHDLPAGTRDPGDGGDRGPSAGGSVARRDDAAGGGRHARDPEEGAGDQERPQKRQKKTARGAQDEGSVRDESTDFGDDDGGTYAKFGVSAWEEQKRAWDMQRFAAVPELGPLRRLSREDVEKLPKAPSSEMCLSYLRSMSARSISSEPL